MEMSTEGEEGCEVQFPPRVLAALEDVLPEADHFDSPDFDTVAYINSMFPTEQSLSGVEAACGRAEYQLAALRQHSARLLVSSHAATQRAHKALHDAHALVKTQLQQVKEINVAASRSEQSVRSITSEMQQLDRGKCNLQAAITALNHLHMLVHTLHSVDAQAHTRRYSEIRLPLQALGEVVSALEGYRDVRQIAALRERLVSIRASLAKQILHDFQDFFTGGKNAGGGAATGPARQRALREACGVLEVLEPHVKRDLLLWLLPLQLQEYEHLFGGGEESAGLGHVDKRYAWLKRRLLAFEEGRAALFPPHWHLSELIAYRFCKMTSEMLSALMEARRPTLEVKELLFAIQRTHAFEELLLKRFQESGVDWLEQIGETPPTTAPEQSGGAGAEAGGAGGGEAGGGARALWLGSISVCFEPYLYLYMESLSANLDQLLKRFVQAQQQQQQPVAVAQQGEADEAGEGGVLASCGELFLLYKKCLVQCAQLTAPTRSHGQPICELAAVFARYLREYCSSVVVRALPPHCQPALGAAQAAPPAPALPPALVHNLSALLNLAPASHRLSSADMSRVGTVIATCEYCLETSAHLELKLRQKVAPRLADRISLQHEIDLFHKVIEHCVSVLSGALEAACGEALAALPRCLAAVAGAAEEGAGAGAGAGAADGSAYVAEARAQMRALAAAVSARLRSERKYWTRVCCRFAHAFTSALLHNFYKCRGLTPPALDQLLLDVHMLKSELLQLPCAGNTTGTATGTSTGTSSGTGTSTGISKPPASYVRLVQRLVGRVELCVKLVLLWDGGAEGCEEVWAARAAQLLPELAPHELARLLAVRADKPSRAQLAAVERSFRRLQLQLAPAQGAPAPS